MKFEVGKKYVDRRGDIAELVLKDSRLNEGPLLFIYNGEHVLTGRSSDGRLCRDMEHGLDFIEEYKEPKYVYLDIYNYCQNHQAYSFFPDKEECLSRKTDDTIALVKIDPEKLKGLPDFTELVPKGSE